MKARLLTLTALLGAALTSVPTQAHHSFAAEFDSNAPINVTGIVVKVDWTNPHTYIHLEVEGDDGEYQEWAMEMGSPNGLMRRGWTRNTLEIGTEVIVKGTRARDGSYKGNVQSVVITETCQRLFAGTSQRDFNEEEAADAQCSH